MTPKTYHLKLEADLPVWKFAQSVELDEPVERDGRAITHRTELTNAEGRVSDDLLAWLAGLYDMAGTDIAQRLGLEDATGLVLKTGTITFNTADEPVAGDTVRGIVRFMHGAKEYVYKVHEELPKYELEA